MSIYTIYKLIILMIPLMLCAEPSLWVGIDKPIKKKEAFHELCMELWTRIDLVQAIATTNQQKKLVLTHIRTNLICIYSSLEVIPTAEVSFYRKVLQSMSFSFVSAFSSYHCKEYTECLDLFKKVISRLKFPVHLKTENSS